MRVQAGAEIYLTGLGTNGNGRYYYTEFAILEDAARAFLAQLQADAGLDSAELELPMMSLSQLLSARNSGGEELFADGLALLHGWSRQHDWYLEGDPLKGGFV